MQNGEEVGNSPTFSGLFHLLVNGLQSYVLIYKSGGPDVPRYVPHTFSYTSRKLKRPSRINGQITDKYTAPLITEYVDVETGEVLPAAEASKRGAWPEIRQGECMALREAALASLRPEVRKFAYFVLRFRNRRRGITPDIDTLANWYGQLHGKRPEHIRRYIPRLVESGIIVNPTLVGDVFQIPGKNTAARDHAREDTASACVLVEEEIRIRDCRRPGYSSRMQGPVPCAGREPARRPEWLRSLMERIPLQGQMQEAVPA